METRLKYEYHCGECFRTRALTPDLMLCPDCGPKTITGQSLRGVLDVRFDPDQARLEPDSVFLPVEPKYFPAIPVGNTPLWSPKRLREFLDCPSLYLKDETRNPTGSLKDRASYLVAAFAREFGHDELCLASTGNAGSSMAGVGAAAGLAVTLFLPERAPAAKWVQAQQYGARVIPVKGGYDQAYELSLAYSKANRVLSRNTGYNPLTIEGKKTVAFEISQQMGGAPDYVFVPTGDGVILSGVYKGFSDLLALKRIERMPVVFAVQAKGADALVRAFRTGRFTNKPTKTLADSIQVNAPRNGFHALRALKKYKGECIAVSDDEILQAQRLLSSRAGLFAEPAAAAALAGFLTVKQTLPKPATTVLLITGNGLKDLDSARIGMPKRLNPIETLDDLARCSELED